MKMKQIPVPIQTIRAATNDYRYCQWSGWFFSFNQSVSCLLGWIKKKKYIYIFWFKLIFIWIIWLWSFFMWMQVRLKKYHPTSDKWGYLSVWRENLWGLFSTLMNKCNTIINWAECFYWILGWFVNRLLCLLLSFTHTTQGQGIHGAFKRTS